MSESDRQVRVWVSKSGEVANFNARWGGGVYPVFTRPQPKRVPTTFRRHPGMSIHAVIYCLTYHSVHYITFCNIPSDFVSE